MAFVFADTFKMSIHCYYFIIMYVLLYMVCEINKGINCKFMIHFFNGLIVYLFIMRKCNSLTSNFLNYILCILTQET